MGIGINQLRTSYILASVIIHVVVTWWCSHKHIAITYMHDIPCYINQDVSVGFMKRSKQV